MIYYYDIEENRWWIILYNIIYLSNRCIEIINNSTNLKTVYGLPIAYDNYSINNSFFVGQCNYRDE